MLKGILLALSLSLLVLTGCGKPTEKYIRNRSVKLISERGSCSGEQVRTPSGTDYILTAAHCRVLEKDGSITVLTEDGKQLQRRVIAEDIFSDLLLIEGLPNVKGLDIAEKEGRQHIRSFTHGAGMPTYKTEGETLEEKRIQVPLFIIENDDQRLSCHMPKNKIFKIEMNFFGIDIGSVEVCLLDTVQMAGTAAIVPGSSGGMIVDDSGDLIGVVSAGGDGFFYYVTLRDIKAFTRNY